MGSFSSLASAADISSQLSDLNFLKLLLRDLPIVVLIEESEDSPGIGDLFPEAHIADIELTPLDLFIFIDVISGHHFFLHFRLLQALQMVRVSECLHISDARLHSIVD